jgi:hypothetical protein
MLRVFRSHVRTTFLTMPTKILTFTRWDRRLKGADSHRPATGWREQESESEWKMCGMVMVVCGLRVLSVRQGYVQNCRVWTESAECETGICAEL